MAVIDVHTHMMNPDWVDGLAAHEGYGLVQAQGKRMISLNGRPYIPVEEEMLDYDMRIKDMDKAGVDLAIISLTTPSVYWADEPEAVRLSKIVNDDMADRERAHPDRLRFFATLPWQHDTAAIAELDRALALGAVGVFVGANLDGMALTDPSVAAVWQAIDDKSLPVLVHPAPLPGAEAMNLHEYNLIQVVGFMADTSIAVARMIYDGFFDRYPNLQLIAAHVGGTLPYIVGRMDACYDDMPPCSEKISEPPSEYMRRIYYDSIGFTPEAIQMCLNVGGEDRVMFGSDYPHLIGHMTPAQERVQALPKKHHAPIFDKTAMRVFGL